MHRITLTGERRAFAVSLGLALPVALSQSAHAGGVCEYMDKDGDPKVTICMYTDMGSGPSADVRRVRFVTKSDEWGGRLELTTFGVNNVDPRGRKQFWGTTVSILGGERTYDICKTWVPGNVFTRTSRNPCGDWPAEKNIGLNNWIPLSQAYFHAVRFPEAAGSKPSDELSSSRIGMFK